MRHSSVEIAECPCEFINITPVNPLISKCQIKVCYVGDEPNRNHSVITKEVAREMANSLPGSPIVGYYNEANQDFEEHNRIIDISNGKFEIKDTTRPYGFVDLSAKCWFKKFKDDDSVEREYLMTEGWLWTGQYPECQRIIEQGNNQSMELDEKTLDASWTKDNNGNYKFFIINEAIISKLCILGDDCEPCFEGSTITKVQFSFEDGFKQQLYSMMNELKELIKEGGAPMFSNYAVEIGDSLWESIYSYLRTNHPMKDDPYCSIYSVEGIYEEENSNKFAILRNREDSKYYRMNFNLSENTGFAVDSDNNFIEVTKTYVPASQFSVEDVENYETEFKKKKEEEEKSSEDSDNNSDEGASEEGEDKEEPKPEEKEEDEEDKKKKKYNLDEIPEYIELNNSYSQLQSNFNTLKAENDALNTELKTLREFKLAVERKEKESMIEGFYMLSDEDKADVRENIDTYSLDDIEAKLAVACYRNKVSFDNVEDEEPEQKAATVYNLGSSEIENEAVPAWIKVAMDVAKSMN